jgi:DNA uptake protein ComE-like DNA-binding protein
MVVLRDDYRLLPVDDCVGLLPSQSVAEGEVGSVLSPLGDEVSREVPTTTAAPTGRCTRGQVDLNTAAPDQLQRLAHVGPTEADAIVAMRPVEDLWELAAVPGMTPEELAELLTQGVACI